MYSSPRTRCFYGWEMDDTFGMDPDEEEVTYELNFSNCEIEDDQDDVIEYWERVTNI